MAAKPGLPETQKKSFITRSPIFYGWFIMAASTLGLIMTGPGQTYTVSIFIEYIIDDLGISRSLVSTLYSAGTLIGSFSLPFWGRQIDRWGTRKMVVIVSLLFGLACIFMGYVQNAIMLAVGFIMVRMLGQGSLGLVSQTVINQWWVRKRGMVVGISGILVALLGMGAFPNFVYALISAFEWRVAYSILGLVLLFLMAPLGLLLFRNRPEDFQLHPDGSTSAVLEEVQTDERNTVIEVNWTLKEAIHTRVFWILALALSSFAMLSTGLFFHLVSIFENRGLNAAIAASVYVPVAVAAAATNFVSGFLADRLPLKLILAIGLLIQAVSLVLAAYLEGTFGAVMFGVLLGATNGVFRTISIVVWPSFYGRENLGSIYGFTSALLVVGAAFGPLPFGFVYDLNNSYESVLLVSAGISFLIGLVCLTIQKPTKNH